MAKILKIIWEKLRLLVDRYPALVAAVVIYSYYLLTSISLFRHHGEKQSILDYVMDFDSLFFLWLAAAALLQVQKMRKATRAERERLHTMERVLDRQQIYTHLINDISMLLQDSVNNPLAVIAVTTQEIRRKFEKDEEIIRWLDRIDGAMNRIHDTIRDIQMYESQKMLETTTDVLKENVRP